MKSLAELQAIKERMKSKVVLREGSSDVRVVIGMATCGIAAGARPVLNAFVEEINNGAYDELIEQVMQKPISEMQELYNTREIEK